MYNNTYFRLIMVMRIGFLLFITACSKYSSRSAIGLTSRAPTYEHASQPNSSVYSVYLKRIFPFCTAEAQQDLIHNAVQIGMSDHLKEWLEYIKSNSTAYPHEKVMFLLRIAGCQGKIKGKKQSSLIQKAVTQQDPTILNILLETLDHYDLKEVLNLNIGDKGGTDKGQETVLDLAFDKHLCFNSSNSLKILEHLLKYMDPWSQIQSKHKSALHVAASRGDSKLLKGMINSISEGSKERNHCKDEETVSKIVNLSDGHHRTLLHYAVLQGKLDMVAYLMELGASCTCFDKGGISPLFIAIIRRDLDMVKLLLNRKYAGNASLQSNINDKGSANLTPLNFAASCKSTLPRTALQALNKALDHSQDIPDIKVDFQIIQELLHASASPDIPDIFGETPLHKAAETGNADSVKSLLNDRADPCIPDIFGETPLHKAAKTGNADSVELLLHAGADPLAEDLKGDIPLGVAFEQIQVRPSREYNENNRIKLSAFILDKAVTLRDPDGVGVKPNLINLWMEIRSNCRYGNHKGQRGRLNQLLHFFVLDKYGVSVKIGSQCKGKKRPCDDFGVSYTSLNKKRKQKNVQQCGLSSGGQTIGTCLDIP